MSGWWAPGGGWVVGPTGREGVTVCLEGGAQGFGRALKGGKRIEGVGGGSKSWGVRNWSYFSTKCWYGIKHFDHAFFPYYFNIDFYG